MRRIIVLTLLALLISIASPAAGFVAHHDPDDTGSLLDFRRVRLLHRHDTDLAVIAIHTYDRRFSRQGFLIRAYFDTHGGPIWDRRADVLWDKGSFELLCDVWARGGREPISECRWRVSNNGTGRIDFPWRLLHVTRLVRWRLVGEGSHGRVVDHAPDRGFYSP